MPVSKKRKTKKHVVRMPSEREYPDRWNYKLNGARLPLLRNDPDFLTFIKIGRANNAVLFALENVYTNLKEATVIQRRQHRRGCIVLAGYLHEALKLVSSIKGRYLTFPEFEPLRAVALDAGHKQARYYIRKIRNYTAFHLDEYDETTRRTLLKLKPKMYTLVSGDNKLFSSTYFDFADEIDLTLLVDELGDGRPPTEMLRAIFSDIFELSQAFLEASNIFGDALFIKIKLGQHLYRSRI